MNLAPSSSSKSYTSSHSSISTKSSKSTITRSSLHLNTPSMSQSHPWNSSFNHHPSQFTDAPRYTTLSDPRRTLVPPLHTSPRKSYPSILPYSPFASTYTNSHWNTSSGPTSFSRPIRDQRRASEPLVSHRVPPFSPSPLPNTATTTYVPNLTSPTTTSVLSQFSTDPPPSIPSFSPLKKPSNSSQTTSIGRTLWVWFANLITFYAFPFCLNWCGLNSKEKQLAWREKMALCTLIFLLMLLLGFLTFALNSLLCPYNDQSMNASMVPPGYLILNGYALSMNHYPHVFPKYGGALPFDVLTQSNRSLLERDVSYFFQQPYQSLKACRSLFGRQYIKENDYLFPCTLITSPPPFQSPSSPTSSPNLGLYPAEFCHPLFPSTTSGTTTTTTTTSPLLKLVFQQFRTSNALKTIYFSWPSIRTSTFFVYNGHVIDPYRLRFLRKPVSLSTLIPKYNFNTIFQEYQGKDITFFFHSDPKLTLLGECLQTVASVGTVDVSSVGCMVAQLIIHVSLIAILALVFIRFCMAVAYKWVFAGPLGRKMTLEEKKTYVMEKKPFFWRSLSSSSSSSSSSSFVTHTTSLNRKGSVPGSLHSSRPLTHFSSLHGVHSMEYIYPSQPSYPFTPLPMVPSANVRRGSTCTLSHTSNPMPMLHSNVQASTYPPSLVPLPPTIPTTSSSSCSDDEPSIPLSSQRLPMASFTQLTYPTSLMTPNFGPHAIEPMHVILLVTCYSECEQGLRATLNSLAQTQFSDSHKLLVVIADGLVKGKGNTLSTPELVLQMMERDALFPEPIKSYPYFSIAESPASSLNQIQVHAGYYVCENHRVPMVCLVKCGTDQEQHHAKPGNRGKRDSQVILMSFLQKCMFDERMSAFEFDFYQKILTITQGVPPDLYEIVLMVDADTKVHPEALDRMVACFAKDPSIMGLCGETQIENQYQSWVTAIQVFEYYISHHLAKSFESVFGGVTCLPGCFSAFRIKAPKTRQDWVPLLANPEIIQAYSETQVDTLHKKNLYLLGEDRYLTTLMLKTFPKRKMIFLPSAYCFTIVPDTFRVLLSQRRRWINSTIHNLMELVWIRDLCGIFCISMQFVILMELIGTLVLPAAISFTMYLVVISFFITPIPIIPLSLLALILGLPGLLIVLTSGRISMLFWMLIYLVSLPIWNLVLPLYAFWHFDDFSWGATRPTDQEGPKNEELHLDEAKGNQEKERVGEKEHLKDKEQQAHPESWITAMSSSGQFKKSSSPNISTPTFHPSPLVMKRYHEWLEYTLKQQHQQQQQRIGQRRKSYTTSSFYYGPTVTHLDEVSQFIP